MTVKMNVHHLEDLVSADRGWARNKFDMQGRGASKYLIGVSTSWYNRHPDELFRLRAKHPPEWQEAPEQWQPLRIHPKTSMTVIGGREAKQQKTKVIVQGRATCTLARSTWTTGPLPAPSVYRCATRATGDHTWTSGSTGLLFTSSRCRASVTRGRTPPS